MIPKKIWQTWKKPYDQLPVVKGNSLRILTETWKSYNPDYEYNYCDDETCLGLLKQYDSELYECVLECDRVNVVSMKADIFRYFVLYRFGGFYADIDTVCYAAINSWLKPDCRFILSPEDNSFFYQQWFLGAAQGHPLLAVIIANIKRDFKGGIDYSNPDFVHRYTGPEMFTQTVMKYFNLPYQSKLRELSAGYNKLNSFKDAGVFIYDDYRFFRDGAPHGVVQHLYASFNWFEDNYDNWRIQRGVINNLPEDKFRIQTTRKTASKNWW